MSSGCTKYIAKDRGAEAPVGGILDSAGIEVASATKEIVGFPPVRIDLHKQPPG